MKLTDKQAHALSVAREDKGVYELQSRPLAVISELVAIGLVERKPCSAWDGRQMAPAYVSTLTEIGSRTNRDFISISLISRSQ